MTDVNITLDIEKLKFKNFENELINFLNKYQMDSLSRRIFKVKDVSKKSEEKKPSNDQIGLF